MYSGVQTIVETEAGQVVRIDKWLTETAQAWRSPQRINVAKWMDASGRTDSFDGLQSLVAFLHTQDEVRSRRWLLDWSGGEYLVTWDGAERHPSASSNSLNYNCCAYFTGLDMVWDMHGAAVVMGGDDYTEWATMFWLHGCKIQVLGGKFDHETKPSFQGTVTTIGADYMDITLESGTAAPGFGYAYEVQPFDSNRRPNYGALARNAYTGTPYTVTSQGGGVYRLSTLTAGEVSGFWGTTALAAGTLCSVHAQRDGTEWFRLVNCEDQVFRGCPVAAAVDSFLFVLAGKNLEMTNCVAEPDDKILGLSCLHRSFANVFSCGGYINIQGNRVNQCHDDPFPIHGLSLGRYTSGATSYTMSRVSSTSFDAFSDAHWFYGSVPAGTKLVIYQDDASEVCRCTVTGVAATATLPVKRFTVSITSGSLPADMSDCIAVAVDYMPAGVFSNNHVENVRGRGLFTSLRGVVSSNRFKSISNEAILIEPSRSNWEYQWQDVRGTLVIGNVIDGAVIDRTNYYPAAMVARAANMDGTTADQQSVPNAATSGVYPFARVDFTANQVYNCKNMALYVGGLSDGSATNNRFYSCGSSGVGTSGEPWDDFDNTIVGVQNTRNFLVANNSGHDCNGRTFVRFSAVGAGDCKGSRDYNNYLLEAA